MDGSVIRAVQRYLRCRSHEGVVRPKQSRLGLHLNRTGFTKGNLV